VPQELNRLIKEASEDCDDLVILDGFDDAVVGTVYDQWGTGAGRLVYNRDNILRILMDRDGMTVDDALEFFDFNICGLYAGKGTPLFLLPDG